MCLQFCKIKISLFFTILFYAVLCSNARDRSVIIKSSDTTKLLSERELIIILPGLGGGAGERRSIKRFFGKRGYDVYIADYISRKTVEKSIENLKKGIIDIKGHEYKNVHIFTYILGGWTLNLYLQKHSLPNIRTIIYDRSPLQERAPYLAAENLRIFSRIAIGNVVKDLAGIAYPPLNKKDISVGLIIENRATPLLRLFKKKALEMGAVYWEAESLHQEYDDFYYTWLNHNQMYDKVAVISDEVLYFISHGTFSPKARKKVYEGDPFTKYKGK